MQLYASWCTCALSSGTDAALLRGGYCRLDQGGLFKSSSCSEACTLPQQCNYAEKKLSLFLMLFDVICTATSSGSRVLFCGKIPGIQAGVCCLGDGTIASEDVLEAPVCISATHSQPIAAYDRPVKYVSTLPIRITTVLKR